MSEIVVATPGCIIDHLRNSLPVVLEDLAILILDEADRLLELGFSVEIHELIRMCPKRRQTMLFSATMTEEIDELVKLSVNKPVRLEPILHWTDEYAHSAFGILLFLGYILVAFLF